jgi:hypothetical protein
MASSVGNSERRFCDVCRAGFLRGATGGMPGGSLSGAGQDEGGNRIEDACSSCGSTLALSMSVFGASSSPSDSLAGKDLSLVPADFQCTGTDGLILNGKVKGCDDFRLLGFSSAVVLRSAGAELMR